jgi:hypothetical protein
MQGRDQLAHGKSHAQGQDGGTYRNGDTRVKQRGQYLLSSHAIPPSSSSSGWCSDARHHHGTLARQQASSAMGDPRTGLWLYLSPLRGLRELPADGLQPA